jgi:hypothetical protein
MNKQFELLLMQAIQETGSAVSNETHQRFAELIVKECADLFDKNETEVRIPEHRIHESIMIHFGLY